MDRTMLTTLHGALRLIVTDLKHVRALDQVVTAYAKLDGPGGGLATALHELGTAADQLAKDARTFAKTVQDLAASCDAPDPITVDEHIVEERR